MRRDKRGETRAMPLQKDERRQAKSRQTILRGGGLGPHLKHRAGRGARGLPHVDRQRHLPNTMH